MYGNYGYMHGFGLGGGIWMWLIWLIPILLIVWVARSFATRRSGESGNAARPKSALEILDEEYARGNVEREEYLRRKADLSGR